MIGAEELFSGRVLIDPLLFKPAEPSRVTCALVTFEPGSRTAWHRHPSGQILIVTSGHGIVQEWGKEPQEIFPGDVVWIPPDSKHWHGAAPHAMMTHIAIQEAVDGRSVEWMEKVGDDQNPAD